MTARPTRIEVLVFVVGAASLGAEIAAARLLAPYFGASTFVWANTIATVLVALSIGYAIGGRLADRAPHIAGLRRVVLVAAILLGVVPLVSGPLLDLAVDALDAVSAGAFLGSLLAVLALVAVPVVLLGAVAPYAVRLTVERVEESGRVAGRLYAISTAGSLVGTFTSALVLIPFLGTRRTFLTFALALAMVAVPGLRRRALVVPLALVALLAIPTGTVKRTGTDGARVIHESETPYQYARVLQDPDGERRLELNEGVAVHSTYRPGSYLSDGYWDEFLSLPFAAGQGAPGTPPREIAILGSAAGTTARSWGHYFPATLADAVEIDGELADLGRRYFDLRGPRLRTIAADARPWLRASDDRYDAIFLDAYRQPYVPFYLTTREFFTQVREHLRPGGVLVVNVGHPEGSDKLERAIAATLYTVFGAVASDRSQPTNTIIAAGDSLSAARLRTAAARHPDLRPLADATAARMTAAPTGGPVVYTDDRAPVEWLVDTSIVRYAAGER